MRRWLRFRLFYLIIAFAVVPTAVGVIWIQWQRRLEMERVHVTLQRELGFGDVQIIRLRRKNRHFGSGRTSEADALVHYSFLAPPGYKKPHDNYLIYVFCAGAPVEGPWFVPEEFEARPLSQGFDKAPTTEDIATFEADCLARLAGESSGD